MMRPIVIHILLTSILLISCKDESVAKPKPGSSDDSKSDPSDFLTHQADDDKEGTPSISSGKSVEYSCDTLLVRNTDRCRSIGLVGTWEASKVCAATEGEDVFASYPDCSNTQFDYDLRYDFEMTITDDNRWTSITKSITGSNLLSVDNDCLAYLSANELTPRDTCDLVFSTVDDRCEYSNGWCTCRLPVADNIGIQSTSFPITSTGAYSLDGATMTTVDDETGDIADSVICVEGDTAYLYTDEPDAGTTIVMVLKRI